MATELRPLRAFSIDKARNLFRGAGVALKDARAPAQYVSPQRRFDAAYDCGLQCALVVLECSKLEVNAQKHHQVAFDFFFSTLKLKGSTVTDSQDHHAGAPRRFATTPRRSTMNQHWHVRLHGLIVCWRKPKDG